MLCDQNHRVAFKLRGSILGDNKQRSLNARAEFDRVLHFLQPATKGWITKAYTSSALTEDGISNIWDVICQFERLRKSQVYFKCTDVSNCLRRLF